FHAARRMSRAAVPAMLAGGGGSLVHVGSDSARLPEVGNMDYAAAKLPLLALSTSLATELSPQGIRPNVVIPGPTRTPPDHPPGEVACACVNVFLGLGRAYHTLFDRLDATFTGCPGPRPHRTRKPGHGRRTHACSNTIQKEAGSARKHGTCVYHQPDPSF